MSGELTRQCRQILSEGTVSSNDTSAGWYSAGYEESICLLIFSDTVLTDTIIFHYGNRATAPPTAAPSNRIARTEIGSGSSIYGEQLPAR